MSLILPYPTQPADGSPLDAIPVAANQNAIASAIQAFDGSQINAGSVSAAALAISINPNTILYDTIANFVQSGCTWSTVSGLAGTMTGGVAFIANASGSATLRVAVVGVGSHTFTASQDTYIDIDYNGNIYYSAVANGAASPALTANSLRVAKIITGSSAITSVVQTGYDSLGNIIYSTVPSKVLKYTDANGWQVHNYGLFRDYLYTTASVDTGLNWGAQGGTNWTQTVFSGIALPVGISYMNSLHFEVTGTLPQAGPPSSPLIFQLAGSAALDSAVSGTLSIIVSNPSANTFNAYFVNAYIRATERF